MVTALYRRYRPETFAELIGQSQVTDPLMTALRTNRVNHAYLFSGPRGCGKTTSARILARCLNCVEGPTDTPCGKCPSCIELSRDGSGSLDVVEIDAASHNGVDDARDLRERAVFAPARDRYKIFILDEAHMVTPQGFNALLKLVEEPPEHVKFVFATTEPEKVIGTIRSRTHHYPFRLVPPAQMLEYIGTLTAKENVTVEPGVLPLVVRAGGGSVRDSLSLLDQLIAGSDNATVEYSRAVALLGYTPGALLDDAIDAIGSRDPAAAFAAIDRVIQTGQDPRRFVEDLLERLRDLILVNAFSGTHSDGAAAALRGIQPDELARMERQGVQFGGVELSRAADVANAALTDMTGATSPRLHLELMVARMLVPASDESGRGTLARVERLERRIGVAAPGSGESPASETPAHAASAGKPSKSPARPSAEPVEVPASESAAATGEGSAPTPAASQPPRSHTPAVPVTLQQVKDAWPEILGVVQEAKRSAWLVVYTAVPLQLRDDVLVLSFPSQADVDGLKQPTARGEGVGDYLKNAVVEVLGFRPKLVAKVVASSRETPPPATMPEEEPPLPPEPSSSALAWETAPIAHSAEAEPVTRPAGESATATPASATDSSAPPATTTSGATASGTPAAHTPLASHTTVHGAVPAVLRPENVPPARQRYGESVVREILGASFIEEQPYQPRVMPRGD